MSKAYIFDIRAWVDSDDVAMLDPEVVSDNSVDAGTPIVEVVVGEHDQDCVFAFLSFDKYRVTSEEL